MREQRGSFIREQHPQPIDPERRVERYAWQFERGEHDGQDARPRLNGSDDTDPRRHRERANTYPTLVGMREKIHKSGGKTRHDDYDHHAEPAQNNLQKLLGS